ncbi:MAG TPA: copper resistance protein CopC [Micromonosporaceae bacterium]|nr:copper resistance protein CopC [Micromonosporaceae bacterium]
MNRAAAALAGALLGLLASLALAAAFATPASAHAALVRTSPTSGAVLAAAPIEVVLTFSEGVSAVPGKVRVIAPDGTRADSGAPVVRAGVVTVPLRSGTPKGTYLVNFRVISADAHPVAGAFTYSVGAPSQIPSPATDNGATNPVVSTLIPIAKYLGYAGLVMVVGPALVLAALWPQRLSRRRPARIVWLGLGTIAAAAVIEVLLQAPYETGTRLSGEGLRAVLGSTFGTAHVIRVAVVVAAAFLLRPLMAGREGTTDRALLAILAVVGVATWSLSGHAAASAVPPVTVLADAAHLSAMAVWLGGLGMLLGFLLRQANERELQAILPIWSRWATLAVSTLLVAGTLHALVEIGTPAALVDTAYGRLVMVKVALFGGILWVAWFSRKLVRSRVAGKEPGRLRRTVAVELTAAAAVVAIAAVLVQTTPGRTAQANQSTAAGPYSTVLNDKSYSLQMDVDPAKTGNNAVHLFAYTPDGKPLKVLEWKATAALPSGAIEPMQIPLLPITENHAIGQIPLTAPGFWEFRFTLRFTEIDQATVATTVHIR